MLRMFTIRLKTTVRALPARALYAEYIIEKEGDIAMISPNDTVEVLYSHLKSKNGGEWTRNFKISRTDNVKILHTVQNIQWHPQSGTRHTTTTNGNAGVRITGQTRRH